MNKTNPPTYYLAKTIAFSKIQGGIKELDLVLKLGVSISQYEKLKAIFMQHSNLSFDRKNKTWSWEE